MWYTSNLTTTLLLKEFSSPRVGHMTVLKMIINYSRKCPFILDVFKYERLENVVVK